jgi:hypothetical protein
LVIVLTKELLLRWSVLNSKGSGLPFFIESDFASGKLLINFVLVAHVIDGQTAARCSSRASKSAAVRRSPLPTRPAD